MDATKVKHNLKNKVNVKNKVKNNVKNKVNDNTTLLIENNSLIETIVKSSLQTKNWRKSQAWYINGKTNECEKYQRTIIETIIKNTL